MDHVWPNTRLISDIFSFLLWKSKSSARVNKALCCEGDCACRTSIYGKGKTVSFFLKYTPLFLNLHTAFSLGLFSFDSSFLFLPTIYSTITIILCYLKYSNLDNYGFSSKMSLENHQLPKHAQTLETLLWAQCVLVINTDSSLTWFVLENTVCTEECVLCHSGQNVLRIYVRPSHWVLFFKMPPTVTMLICLCTYVQICVLHNWVVPCWMHAYTIITCFLLNWSSYLKWSS